VHYYSYTLTSHLPEMCTVLPAALSASGYQH
jgi:hypothetical protein